MTRETTIITKLEERNKILTEKNEEIIEILARSVLPAMVQIMELTSEEATFLKVHEVDVYEGLVIVIGEVNFPIGHVLEHEGQQVTVTEDTEMYFRRWVRVGVPPQAVEDFNIEQMVDFLKKHGGDNEAVPFPDSDISADFDVDGLSDEHKEKLRLFAGTTKGTKN